MPLGDIKQAAKRKVKDKAVSTAKRKISNRSSGKKSGNKKFSPILIVVILLVVIGAAVAAWHFGLLDSLLQGEDTVPTIVAVDGNMEIHFIDVGQADAVFIITSEGTMLIDAGSRRSGPRVVEYLQELGTQEITYVVGTHPHEDHIGGMDLVINAFDIGTFMMPDVVHTTRTFERMIEALENEDNIVGDVTTPTRGDVFEMGGAIFTILHPGPDHESNNLNDWSISKRVAFGNFSMITTGDAEVPAEREMLETVSQHLNADVLRLGHHGSRTSTMQEFFDAVNPSITIIQVGADNRYGHPHPEVMERIEGTRIYRNDLHGDIILTTDGTNIDISTER